MAKLRTEKKKEILNHIQNAATESQINLIEITRDSIIEKFKDSQFDKEAIDELIEGLIEEDNAISSKEIKLSILIPQDQLALFSKKFKKHLEASNLPSFLSLLLTIIGLYSAGSSASFQNPAVTFSAGLITWLILYAVLKWVYNRLSAVIPELKKINNRLINSIAISDIVFGLIVYGYTYFTGTSFTPEHLLGVLTLGTGTGIAIRNILFSDGKTDTTNE